MIGTYVTLVLTNVNHPRATARAQANKPFTWFSLHRHENRVSVLNFNIQRTSPSSTTEGVAQDGSAYEVVPIKSKEELIFMVCLYAI